jgi:Protein of unknown function (DUF1580)
MPIAEEMIDLAAEIAGGAGIKLIELAHQQHTNPSTTFRWAQRGLPRGDGTRIRLECIKRGKKWITTAAAVKRFFAALPATAPAAPTTRTPGRREREQTAAKKMLGERYGI